VDEPDGFGVQGLPRHQPQKLLHENADVVTRYRLFDMLGTAYGSSGRLDDDAYAFVDWLVRSSGWTAGPGRSWKSVRGGVRGKKGKRK